MNISIVSRRHYLDAVGDPPNANTTRKKWEDDHVEKAASTSQDPSISRFAKRTTNDPEKQELIDGARTRRHKFHYGGGYNVLVLALVLGIVLYGLDMVGWFRCSSNASS